MYVLFYCGVLSVGLPAATIPVPLYYTCVCHFSKFLWTFSSSHVFYEFATIHIGLYCADQIVCLFCLPSPSMIDDFVFHVSFLLFYPEA